MASYAAGTSVSTERSRVEIEKTLRRFGADRFAYGWAADQAEQIEFRITGRTVRLTLPIPDPEAVEFTHSPAGRERTQLQAQKAWEDEVKRRWRSLLLVVKAKLTAVADGISTLEREFLADVVLADGRTVQETAGPTLELAAVTRALMPGDSHG